MAQRLYPMKVLARGPITLGPGDDRQKGTPRGKDHWQRLWNARIDAAVAYLQRQSALLREPDNAPRR